MTKKPINWNPADGDALQGDVCLFAIPAGIAIATSEEIEPRGNRLILAEGGVTGHHHAITLKAFRPQPTMLHDEALARSLEAKKTTSTAKLYRAPETIRVLEVKGYITTTSLAIGVLVVEGGPVTLSHDEHDAIRIPPGSYYVGGQREWDAAEERRIAD